MDIIGTVAEKSSALITAQFEDVATGSAATPKTAIFHVVKPDGTKVVDGRACVISGTEAQCLLSGNDLIFDDDGIRILVVEATYDSVLGNDLPAKTQIRFRIEDLVTLSGSILVPPTSAVLNDLADVDITSPADGESLVYDIGDGTWKNVLVAGGGGTTLAALTDVTITTVAEGEVLVYDSGSADWINKTLVEAGIAADTHTHLEADVTDLDKYTQAEVDALTWVEADITDLDKYTQAEVDALTWVEADITDLDKYTQAEVDALTWVEADITDLDKYTQAEVDAALALKSDATHLHDGRYYTETETDSLLSGKSDTTHNHDSDYVELAGDTMTGDLDLGDNQLQQAELLDYSEEVSADTDSGTTHTIDLELGNVQALTLTGNCTLTFSNPPATGKAGSFTLVVTQDLTGSRTITWPASVDWAGGTAPTLTGTASTVDIFTFFTTDAGTTWYGFTSGLDMS